MTTVEASAIARIEEHVKAIEEKVECLPNLCISSACREEQVKTLGEAIERAHVRVTETNKAMKEGFIEAHARINGVWKGVAAISLLLAGGFIGHVFIH